MVKTDWKGITWLNLNAEGNLIVTYGIITALSFRTPNLVCNKEMGQGAQQYYFIIIIIIAVLYIHSPMRVHNIVLKYCFAKEGTR
jgi:hypothetical protein